MTTTKLEEIQQAILEFFEERGDLPGDSVDEKLDCAYLWAGVITSVGLVELVMMLERRFSIRFSADDLQSEQFHSCRGVADLVLRRMASTS